MPSKVLAHLLEPPRAGARRPTLDPAHDRLDVAWWRACRSRTYQANRLRMQRLAVYSRERLHAVTATLKLDYERSDGYLVLLRSPKDLALAQPGLASLD